MRFYRHHALAVVFGLVALLVNLAGLTACSTSGGGTSAVVATSTPTLDPQLQSYVSALNTYYRPLGHDMNVDDGWEYNTCFQCSMAGQAMVQERPVEVRIAGEAQGFLDQMKVDPPTQLQTDDRYIKQAAKVTASLYTKRVSLIDAQDVQGFNATVGEAIANRDQYCGPIADINVLLPSSAQFPVSNMACQYGFPTPTP